METLEIIGFKRANLGKTEARKLRERGNVPCVLYGGEEQVHFYAPMILFKELIYTSEVHLVKLDIEGTEYQCILQDIQFHPVNDMILHADFLVLNDRKPIKMEVPVHFVGKAPGIQEGGKLIRKNRKLWVKALPPDMPAHINVPIDTLELGKSVKVGDLEAGNYEFLTGDRVTIASVQIPRVLVVAVEEEEELEEEELEEGAEGAEPIEGIGEGGEGVEGGKGGKGGKGGEAPEKEGKE